ncbi:GIY-YIG nuclease family protein [Echinicola arenosa]|uniref:GIY-YIG nuclease family protein n=1 Tax=Echinicola arenosa TaxID=2774144 RepID=UPI001CDD0F3F|nr:GIY-YIG nuclease family protein [Echinicola arenosa]
MYHHNQGLTPSTKSGAPHWEIRYFEEYEDRTAALKREYEIKKKKAGSTSNGFSTTVFMTS